MCHLDLQPDNIVMASVRSLQVKLVDFGCAQKVSKLGDVVKFHSAVEYTGTMIHYRCKWKKLFFLITYDNIILILQLQKFCAKNQLIHNLTSGL